MKKLIVSLTIGAALILPAKIEAQSLGLQSVYPFTPYALAGNTTNQFPINAPGQVFIPTPDVDYIGLQLTATPGTNQTSLATGANVNISLAKSGDGMWPDSSNTTNITVFAKTAVASTNLGALLQPDSTIVVLDSHGMAGWYVLQVWTTNAANTATNYLTLHTLAKAAKVEAVPSSTRN